MRKYWSLLAVILLAFALRLLGLGYKSLWIDEADSIYFAQRLWSALLFRLCDPHPPGYYALLKVFIDLAGASEVVVRLPSALAGGLSVAVVARLGRELAGLLPATWVPRRWGWFSAALLAVAPLHIWYSQEARMYGLVTLLGLSAAVFTVRLMRRWRWADGLGYLATASMAFLADQTALPVLLGLNVLWVATLRQRRPYTLGLWLALQVGVALSFWLWWRQALYIAQLSAETLYPLTMLRLTLMGWAEMLQPWSPFILGIGLLLLGGLLALCLTRFRYLSAKMTELARSEKFWTGLVVGLYLLGGVVSVVPRLYTVKRLLVTLLPYALLIVAWVVERFAARLAIRAAILGFALFLSLINIWLVPKAPWREAIAVIEAQIGAADVIWVDELAVPAFDYYAQGRHDRRVLRVADLDAVSASHARAPMVWFVVQTGRHRDVFEYLPHLDPSAANVMATWPGVEVRAYATAQTPVEAFAPASDIPSWILAWPSPLDEACAHP